MTTEYTAKQITDLARVEHLRILAGLDAGIGVTHLLGYDYDAGNVGDVWELCGFVAHLACWGCTEGDTLTVRGRWLLEWLRGRFPDVCPPQQPGPNDVTIRYFAEALGDGRGQMRRDVTVDGELIGSTLDGSPAPLDTVRAHERVVRFKVV